MSLDPDLEEMRRLGHLAVDLATRHLADLRGRRVITPPVGATLRALCAEPLPIQGHGIENSLGRFFADLLPHATLVNHPRFFAYIPGPGSFAGALGEWVAAATNTFVGTWLGGAVMAQLEVETLQWLGEAVGLGRDRTGLVTTGGSMANLCGIAAGLGDQPRENAAVYASVEGHYSLAKAGKVLGVRHVRGIAADADQRLDIAALGRAIETDRAAGIAPTVVCATAGTTNTGSIDPLAPLAELCARERLWLHVDAAYGAAAALVPALRPAFAGWERADSVAFDPHKWFYAPFECGCVLVRDGARLAAAFGGDADYMQDVPRQEVNFFALGPELSRGARALKLWFLLRSHGIAAIAEHVQRDVELCRRACERLRRDRRIEVLTPPRLSIFTFAVQGGDAAGRRLIDRVQRDGFLMLSSTRVNGRFAIRFCVANHRTTGADVDAAVDRLLELLDALDVGEPRE